MGKHSIIVIKNKNNEYLQYFDKKWDSYLFLNCKMENSENKEEIIKKISNDLSIMKNKIVCEYIGEKEHQKFSESDKIKKNYIHYFYEVKVEMDLNRKEFEKNKIKYKWFTYDELLSDKRIQEVNSDILGFMKEFNM